MNLSFAYIHHPDSNPTTPFCDSSGEWLSTAVLEFLVCWWCGKQGQGTYVIIIMMMMMISPTLAGKYLSIIMPMVTL
jgi:hypothetical protein